MTASSSIHSNAFNFLSSVGSGVDPRTGQFTCSISLPELRANSLAGPVVPLELTFNPLNTSDPGFGVGWNLRLSSYSPGTGMLSLYTGETFKVTGSGPEPAVSEKKLDTFHFYNDDNGIYRVVHKSGLVEILQDTGVSTDRMALPQTLISPEGRRLFFHYDVFAGTRTLTSVSDEQRKLLTISRDGNLVFLRLHPTAEMPVEFRLELTGSGDDTRLNRLVLPASDAASWRFNYEMVRGLLCITEVQTPVGAHETIEYSDAGHAFPGGARAPLPRVTRRRSDPKFGQEVSEVRYSYSANGNNFLGNNAPISWEDGLDNLYRVAAPYDYSTTEELWQDGKAVRRVERTFNRFHLLIAEQTTQGDCVRRTETEYYGDDTLPFERQPPYCQLPKKVTQSWWRLSDPSQKRSETVTTTYDDWGNLLTQVQANGVTKTYAYYPAAGEAGYCPADPYGFVRSLKSRTVIPAQDGHLDEAAVLRTRYSYLSMPPLLGSGGYPWLAVESEQRFQVTGGEELLLEEIRHAYHDVPHDPVLHGRRAARAVTLNGLTTRTNYAYSLRTASRSAPAETVLQTVETLTGFDGTSRVVVREHSLLHGQPLLARDDNDVEIAYSYDVLGRVTAETVAPGTAYQASRVYAYYTDWSQYERASRQVTDVKGVRTRTVFDGLGRPISESRQDVEGDTGFRETWSASYDALDQLVAETEIDWLGPVDANGNLPLTTQYQYDDWGQQYRVRGPDGVTVVREDDPVRLTRREWRESADGAIRAEETLTKLSLSGRSEWSERLAADGSVAGRREYRYDGLGRCTQELDELGRVTRNLYDPWGRLTGRVLPDGTALAYTFAAHSTEELPVTLQVTPGGAEPVVLGHQAFDGLDRRTLRKVGPRVETYRYQMGPQVSERITPAGAMIQYEYHMALTDEPRQRTSPEEQVELTYDSHSALLTRTASSQGQWLHEYDSHGHLSREIWSAGNRIRMQQHRSSRLGRLLVRTPGSEYHYDRSGRAERVTQGQLTATFGYDELGRLNRTVTSDGVRSVETTTQFDAHGREVLRRMKSLGEEDQVSQRWHADGRLAERHWQSGGRSLLNESFEYDVRGRLAAYHCSGANLPQDPYGNAITEQLFSFDALDNITSSQTTFADGSRNTSTFRHGPDDPCQLTKVTHSHPAYPEVIELRYDANGNQVTDEEEGRQLEYDSLSRLVSVSDASSAPLCHYGYDPLDRLIGVTGADGAETRLFWEDGRLSGTLTQGRHTQYLYHGGQALGEQQPGTSEAARLYLTDARGSVTRELHQEKTQVIAYTPYGHRPLGTGLSSLLGFNGELPDLVTGYYPLGNGYRAYNPRLMRFNSPDSESPFGKGGLNPYAYCMGDPINFSDPTGRAATHSPRSQWLIGILAGYSKSDLDLSAR